MIITLMNVCRIHVNTGVLAQMKLTTLNVTVLQVTKVCKAEFVPVTTFLTNAISSPGNFSFWKSLKSKKLRPLFDFQLFCLQNFPGKENVFVKKVPTYLREFSFSDDQAQTITAGMPA